MTTPNAPTEPARLPTFQRRLLENVLAMLTLRETQETIAARCRDELHLADPSSVEAVVERAREGLKRATAIAELQALFDAYSSSDFPHIALGARRELNKLLALYATVPGAVAATDLAAEEGPFDPQPARPHNESAEELFDAIDAHIEPLLPEDVQASYCDRVAAAGRLIRQLKKRKPRKATRRKKGRRDATADH